MLCTMTDFSHHGMLLAQNLTVPRPCVGNHKANRSSYPCVFQTMCVSNAVSSEQMVKVRDTDITRTDTFLVSSYLVS